MDERTGQTLSPDLRRLGEDQRVAEVADDRRIGSRATGHGYGCPELTAALMMHVRGGMSKDNSRGPEDIIVSEIIRELPTEVSVRDYGLLQKRDSQENVMMAHCAFWFYAET